MLDAVVTKASLRMWHLISLERSEDMNHEGTQASQVEATFSSRT